MRWQEEGDTGILGFLSGDQVLASEAHELKKKKKKGTLCLSIHGKIKTSKNLQAYPYLKENDSYT